MSQDSPNAHAIPVMMSVELFDAAPLHVGLFETAMRDLNWSHFEDRPKMFWTSLDWRPGGDSEILATCKQHLAIAASSAKINEFEGTVILGLPEENWQPLPPATE